MRRPPLWPIAAVVLFVLVWIASTIYLALALAICIGLLMFVYWLFTEIPARLCGGGKRPQPPVDPKRRGSR